jgi:F0F1-type ATP synthase assembly protein I
MDEPTPPPDQPSGSDPPPPSDPPSHLSPVSAGAVELLTLGLAAAVSLALGGGIGYLIDRWAGTSPVFTLLGVAFGATAAVLTTITRIRKYL